MGPSMETEKLTRERLIPFDRRRRRREYNYLIRCSYHAKPKITNNDKVKVEKVEKKKTKKVE